MRATTAAGAASSSLAVGARVEVPERGHGTVRFMGAVHFSPKDNWVGIELDLPKGNHDGAVKGVRYFKCSMNHGLFVTKGTRTLILKGIAAKPAAVGSQPINSTTAVVLANSLSQLSIRDIERSQTEQSSVITTEGWLNYSIAKSCKAHNVHAENLHSVTFEHLMSCGASELQELAGSNLYTRSVLRRLQQHAKDYKFWADALVNTDTVFSLGESHHFVITPQLINTLPSEAKEFVRDLEFEGPDDPNFAFKELFNALADVNFPSGPFSLPMLDLECRREALADLTQFIKQRHMGSANGNGGSGRILLGPKGTGKSAFLQALAIVAALLCPNLTVIYISYADVPKESPPVSPALMTYYADLCVRGSAALGELPLFPPDDDWQAAANFLRRVSGQRRFLIIADEFNKVYSAKDRGHIVAQFHSIGQATNGRVSPILSGSSAALFNLCYGHIDRTSMVKYPSYDGVSLNSGRYIDLRMRPARGREQFRSMLEHISQAAKYSHKKHQFFDKRDLQKVAAALNDDRQLMQLYALTGGRFRYLKELFGTEESCAVPRSRLVERILREFSEQWASNSDFKAVMTKLVEKKDTIRMASAGIPEREAAVDAFWAEAWVHFRELSDAGISEARIYEMGDTNLLFVESTKAGLRVTFEAGIQEDLCRARLAKVSLEPYDCVCLRYPYGQLGIDAESLVLRSLATNAQALPMFGPLHYAGRKLSMIPCCRANRKTILKHLSQQVIVCGDPTVLNKPRQRDETTQRLKGVEKMLPCNELLKEYPDKQGADAILFLPQPNEAGVHVWRFQVKLGQSNINKTKAKTIAHKLKNGDEQVGNVLRQIPPGTLQATFSHCLITTRCLDTKAREHFKTQNVLVLGREEMYSVWIEPIKEFDRSIGLGVFASV